MSIESRIAPPTFGSIKTQDMKKQINTVAKSAFILLFIFNICSQKNEIGCLICDCELRLKQTMKQSLVHINTSLEKVLWSASSC